MQYMFGSCYELTSLDISSFNSNNCKNFTNMFKNDKNLELYINSTLCKNLIDTVPEYVRIYNYSRNFVKT